MKDKKPNTLQAKLGFSDDDLKKPSHDKLMLWLDKNIQNILDGIFVREVTDDQLEIFRKEVFQELGKVVTDRTKVLNHYASEVKTLEQKSNLNEHEKQKLKEYNQRIEAENKKINYASAWNGFKSKPSKPKIEIIAKKWELPITTQSQYYSGTSSKYTVGFVDMAVQFRNPRPYVSGIFDEKESNIPWLHSESLKNIKDEVIVTYYTEPIWVYIEVKTEIKSLGELIRQINHYKEYLSGYYYVLSPDSQYESVLAEQGIGTIEHSGN